MIYISTKRCGEGSFEGLFDLLNHFGDKAGVELFPMFHHEEFGKELEENIDRLSEYKVAFHSPYYGAEFSQPADSPGYKRTFGQTMHLMEYAEDLHPEYLVYHFNKMRVNNKYRMTENSIANLKKLSEKVDTPILIENTGLKDYENVLFDEDEFIGISKKLPQDIALNIGYAEANNWDLGRVIPALKDKIRSYQLSADNFRNSKGHFFENTPHLYQFIDLYKEYTPDADLVFQYRSEHEGTAHDIEKLACIFKLEGINIL